MEQLNGWFTDLLSNNAIFTANTLSLRFRDVIGS